MTVSWMISSIATVGGVLGLRASKATKPCVQLPTPNGNARGEPRPA